MGVHIRQLGRAILFLSLVLQFWPDSRCHGQLSEPITPGPFTRGGSGSLLGPSPGDPGSLGGQDSGQILGASAGISSPRVPVSASVPGGGSPSAIQAARIAPPPIVPPAQLPIYGSLSLPEEAEDDGPPGGLTLDQAIEILVRENLTLKAIAYEIPQAQADILTASLRANPLLFADAQLVPYGNYSDQRPGGPVQYDVNVTLPLDLSHKREARMAAAGRAKQVLEAQYQDAVRLQIANLYTAFVDVLAARETLRFSRASLEGLECLARLHSRRGCKSS